MANLPTYASREVRVSFLSTPLSGLAPDSFVSFSRNSNITDSEVGADGSVSISMSPDRTGTCTISLQQQSPGNIFLAAIMELQDQNNEIAKGPMTVTDPSGSVIATLSGCHIMTAPEIGLGSSATGQTRDWVFFCESMKFLSVPEGAAASATAITDAAAAVATAKELGSFIKKGFTV